MWGTKGIRRTRRLLGAGLLLSLGACATHHAAPPTAANPTPRPEGRDATGAYRFNMTQNGRRMTADEFDAWMKARGIRVAKGAPGAVEPARATAQVKPKAPARARAKSAVAGTGKPQPAAARATPAQVASAKPAVAPVKGAAQPKAVAQAGKPKPKAKPAAKAVSEAKTVTPQGASEG